MDLSFFRRGFAGGAEAQLDYGLLTAALQTMQASSVAARAEAEAAETPTEIRMPLVDLLLGAPRWREAAAALRGSFNRAQAETIGKVAAMQMTEPFTFAF